MVRQARALQGASLQGGRGGRAAEGVCHGRSAGLEEGSGWRARRRASWRCVLKPVDATHSRLMARARGGAPPTLWACVMGTTFWDPAHLVMERRMLRTIKRPAEQSSELRRLRAGTGPRLDHHKIQDRPAIPTNTSPCAHPSRSGPRCSTSHRPDRATSVPS
jgi:hypothetical protein